MEEKLKNAAGIFIDIVGNTGASLGLSRFVVQIYALLYMSPGRLSLEDIAKRLRASKGNVSINMRTLMNWGAVKKIWQRGSRKDFYEANRDVGRIIANKLKTGLRQKIDDVMEGVDEMEKMLNSSEAGLTAEEEKKTYQAYRERIKEIRKISGKVNSLLKLANLSFL